MDFTGRPLTARGTKPGLSEVSMARLFNSNVYTDMECGVDGGWNGFSLVDDFHDVEAAAGNDAHLRRADPPSAQGRQAEGLDGLDEQVPALLLVLVTGQPRLAQELRRVR